LRIYHLCLAKKAKKSKEPKVKQVREISNFSHLREEDQDLFQKLVNRSNDFESKQRFPVEDNDIRYCFPPEEVVENARKCRPVLHAEVVRHIVNFLEYKTTHGNEIEVNLYKGMTPVEMIQRLIYNRPLIFFGSHDRWLLRDGKTGGVGHWNEIGTLEGEAEGRMPSIQDYLTYDEICLAALLGVSTMNHFINSGSRSNRGRKGGVPYIQRGVYVGLVGARFEKEGFMEQQFMAISPDQNSSERGYGSPEDPWHKFWADFYGVDYFLTYEQALELRENNDSRVASHSKYDHLKTMLDVPVFRKRINIAASTFLFEADFRGAEEGRPVHAIVVGLGTGVWALQRQNQERLMVEEYKKVMESSFLPNVKHVRFYWFNESTNRYMERPDELIMGESIVDCGGNEIEISFNQIDPFVKIESNPLVVAMYAWDGNSFPGNEYWQGMLTASGDPAAASCSTIGHLQNPMINSDFVCGENSLVLVQKDDGTCDRISIREFLGEKVKGAENLEEEEEVQAKDPAFITLSVLTPTIRKDMVMEGEFKTLTVHDLRIAMRKLERLPADFPSHQLHLTHNGREELLDGRRTLFDYGITENYYNVRVNVLVESQMSLDLKARQQRAEATDENVSRYSAISSDIIS